VNSNENCICEVTVKNEMLNSIYPDILMKEEPQVKTTGLENDPTRCLIA
jgi:hypothetical protein